MDVEAAERVGWRAGRCRETSQEVEGGHEVGVEPLVTRADENTYVARRGPYRVDGCVGERFVVGSGVRSHVGGCYPRVGYQGGAAGVRNLGEGVALLKVQVGILRGGIARGQWRTDRDGVVEERATVDHGIFELELVDEVGLRVSVYVDVDLIEGAVRETVMGRPVARLLHRDVVGDEGHLVGVGGTDEGIDVGVVGGRILRNERRVVVAGAADHQRR